MKKKTNDREQELKKSLEKNLARTRKKSCSAHSLSKKKRLSLKRRAEPSGWVTVPRERSKKSCSGGEFFLLTKSDFFPDKSPRTFKEEGDVRTDKQTTTTHE
jgi:hypothetical protein